MKPDNPHDHDGYVDLFILSARIFAEESTGQTYSKRHMDILLLSEASGFWSIKPSTWDAGKPKKKFQNSLNHPEMFTSPRQLKEVLATPRVDQDML